MSRKTKAMSEIGSKIEFVDINPSDHDQAQEFAVWTRDPAMVLNWTRQLPEREIRFYSTEDFKQQFSENKNQERKTAFMMKIAGSYIGYAQIFIDHPVAITKAGKVAWPSLAIGNANFRNKGYGKLLIQQIIKISIDQQCDAVEIGIFEFNQPMKTLLIRLGFKLIGTK